MSSYLLNELPVLDKSVDLRLADVVLAVRLDHLIQKLDEPVPPHATAVAVARWHNTDGMVQLKQLVCQSP